MLANGEKIIQTNVGNIIKRTLKNMLIKNAKDIRLKQNVSENYTQIE